MVIMMGVGPLMRVVVEIEVGPVILHPSFHRGIVVAHTFHVGVITLCGGVMVLVVITIVTPTQRQVLLVKVRLVLDVHYSDCVGKVIL